MAARLNRAWLPGVIIGVLLGAAVAMGLILSSRLLHRIEAGPDPVTIAQASLRAVQREQKLTVFAARFSAVVTSQQTRMAGILSAQKTLIVPGTVRYEVDLARLSPQSLAWDKASRTLTLAIPAPQIAGPEIDLTAMREYKDGAILFALTDAERSLDTANRGQVMAALLAEARAPALTTMARDAAAAALARSFALPLAAAGVEAKVVVTVAP